MLMMGLELMINGVIVAGGGFWYFVAPRHADGQVLVLVVVTAMAMEMAIGFAVVTALFRAREVDMTDDAGDLQGMNALLWLLLALPLAVGRRRSLLVRRAAGIGAPSPRPPPHCGLAVHAAVARPRRGRAAVLRLRARGGRAVGGRWS